MRNSIALLSLPIALALACGSDANTDPGSSGGSAGISAGGSPSGGELGAAGSKSGSAGVGVGVGGAGNGGAPVGGGGSAGTLSAAGQGASGGGADGSSGASAAGGGSGGAGACTRELLKGAIDAYFTALAAHSPAALSLADGVKHTENGKTSKLGDDGLWKTAGARKYAHSALDTEVCMSATQAVVPDGAKDVPVALRLRLVAQKISESELIVAREGDYPALDANPAALIASNDEIKWEQVVPAEQRATRAELTGWMDKYFKRFPAGVCNTTSDCLRIENGGGNFICGQGASCASGTGSGQAVLDPRLILADVETGLGVGFTIFTGGYIDMHLFKMYGDQVYAVSAILANGNDSGWE